MGREPTLPLAISNIAWPPAEEAKIAALLPTLGVRAVEVAPTTRWPSPPDATPDELGAYRAGWESRGLSVVAAQSLLYGRDDLQLFGEPARRAATLDYLRRTIETAAALGARALVFGSPRNRRVGTLARADAERVAVGFFSAAGDVAARHGAILCLEPNPPQYGCDFLTTTAECADFLRLAAAPGLGLNLDAGALALNGEDPMAAVETARPWLRHVHVSEPYLAAVGEGPGEIHTRLASALATHGYEGWISIEMRPPNDGPALPSVVAGLERTRALYAPLLA